jgi:predicted lipoprotein with Yx(FWY)xxD motif
MKTVLMSVLTFLAISTAGACVVAGEPAPPPAEPIIDVNAPLTTVALADGRNILADSQNLTIYIFDVDTTSESTCYDACEKAWPPVLLADGQQLGANMGVTIRKDGSQQLTHNGRPVYYFVGDSAPGDINGDGLGNVWHIVAL